METKIYSHFYENVNFIQKEVCLSAIFDQEFNDNLPSSPTLTQTQRNIRSIK